MAPQDGLTPRISTGSCSASSPRHPGWACSSRTCCSSPGSTSSARWTSRPVDLLTLAADAVQDARIVAPGPDDRPERGARRRVPGGGRRAAAAAGHREPGEQRPHAHPAGHVGPGHDRLGDADARRRPAVVLDVDGRRPRHDRRAGAAGLRAVLPRRRGPQPRLRRHRPGPGDRRRPRGRARRQVSVSTAPGEGADFRVKLPLSPDAQGGRAPTTPTTRTRRQRSASGRPRDVPQLADECAPCRSRASSSTRSNSAGLPPYGSGHVRAVQVRDVTEQPDPPHGVRRGVVLLREGAQVREVGGCPWRGQGRVRPARTRRTGGPGARRRRSRAAPAASARGGFIGSPTCQSPVPALSTITRSCQARRGELGAEHDLGHRGAADVAQADAAHPVRP